MSEFITIQIGQCGNQIGSQFWPLILQEYGINDVPGGVLRKDVIPNSKNYINESFNSFFSGGENFIESKSIKFSDTINSNLKARAILVDMEDSVVSRFHTGPLKHLFDSKCTIRNYPGSGNNWAEGYFTHGQKYNDLIRETLRGLIEECDSLHGFLIMHSVGGGTGSGLGSYILENLEDEYTNIDRFVTCVYPTGTEDVITCPYNMILTTKQLIDYATCVFPVENRSLLDIVKLQHQEKNSKDTLNHVAKCSPFQDMNTIIVNMLLNLTCGSRFSGSMNVDMSDIRTNLIPFPKMQFLSTGLSPITVSVDRIKNHMSSVKVKTETFINSCHKKNQLLHIDPLGLKSVVLGSCLIGRGDFSVNDMRNYVSRLQTRAHFTQWSTKSIRTGLCEVPPSGHNISMLSIFNTSSMKELFIDVLDQFYKLYNKKAHLHHYTRVDGFEKVLFDECQETLLTTLDSYRAVTSGSNVKKTRYKVI